MISIYNTLIFWFCNLKNPSSITVVLSTLLSFLSHLQSTEGKKTDTQNYFIKIGTIPEAIFIKDMFSVIHQYLVESHSRVLQFTHRDVQDKTHPLKTQLISHIYLPHTHIYLPHTFACRNLCMWKFRTKPLLQGLTSDIEITMETLCFLN